MKKNYSDFSLFLLTQATVLLILLTPSSGLAGVSFGVHLGHGYYGHPYGYGHHYGYGHYYSYPYGYYGHPYGYGHHYAYPYGYYGHTGYYYPHRSYPSHRGTYTGDHYRGNGHAASRTMGTDSAAWRILAQGRSEDALRVFAQEAENHPSKGVPKVGYALASASSGDLNRGVWAMRRAFRMDPDSLDYLHFDEKAVTVIDQLIGKYQIASRDEGHPDEAFMLSALNYLRHDYKTANEALDRAVRGGDKSASLTNLQRLIRDQLSKNNP